jgi:DNA-binding PadR family transcriptional regulator
MFRIPERSDKAVDVPERAGRSRTTTVESLLVMLSLRPMTGYQIRLAIQRTIGNFWQESFGQIYPALRRMEAEGLIQSSGAAENGNGSRRVYSLTEAGQTRLRDWLELPCDRQVMRDELLLKLFAGSKAPAGSLESHVRAYRDLVAEDLRRYREVEKRLPEAQSGNPELPYIMMTLRQGLLKAEALLRWSEQTIDELRKLQGGRARPDRPVKRLSSAKGVKGERNDS